MKTMVPAGLLESEILGNNVEWGEEDAYQGEALAIWCKTSGHMYAMLW